MSETPDRIGYFDPSKLSWDEDGHVRSEPASASKSLKRNIEDLGRLVQPVHARRVDGDLLVFDGWRRINACEHVGIPVATLVYPSLERADALAKSLKLNDKGAGVAKGVTDSDREKSLMMLVTGEHRSVNEWEDATNKLHKARYRLGLDGDEDRIAHRIGGADGVGNGTVAALADHFNTPEDVFEATEVELREVSGVGPKTAENIVMHIRETKAGAVVVREP